MSSLGILVPMNLLLGMFQKGVESLLDPPTNPEISHGKSESERAPLPQHFSFEDYLPGSPHTPAAPDGMPPSGYTTSVAFTFDKPTTDTAGQELDHELHIPNTTCNVMMLDVLLKQVSGEEGGGCDSWSDVLNMSTEKVYII